MTVRGEKLRGAAAPAPLSYFETDAALRGLWAMQAYALFYAAFITALGKLPIHLMSEGEQRAILLLFSGRPTLCAILILRRKRPLKN